MEVIQELASQLGIATEYVLTAYVPYYIGKVISVSIISFVFLIASSIALVIVSKKKYYKDTDIKFIIFTMLIGTVICSLIVFAITFPDTVGAICSPTGAAINFIARMVI